MAGLGHQCFVLGFIIEMSNDLNLDVYFPQFAQYLLSGNVSPAFAKLCAVGTWQINAKHALEASLCKQFGIAKQADWPLAPLALMGEGIDQEAGYWFLVHPVHFVLQRDFFTLGEALSLSPQESATLLADLNRQFSEDSLRFLPSQSGDFWYLHMVEHVDVASYSIAQALGRDVGKHMPHGKHGMKFQALLNEVQMLLHDHAINAAREQKGLPAVNSIWLSGGGSVESMTKPFQTPMFQLFANDALSVGLAKWAGIPCQPLSIDLTTIHISAMQSDHAILVLDHANDLEAICFSPLLKALKQGALKSLRCHFDVHGMTFTLHLKTRDTWKFWRKLNPNTSYFNLVNN
jgi:hypothetical protein